MGKKSPLYDILNNIKMFKTIVNEVKGLSPELMSFLNQLGISNQTMKMDANTVRSAISFAVNKVMNNPYIVLGVSTDDPPELVEAVYKLKAKFYHPDNKQTGNQEKFMKITDAYNKIKECGDATRKP